MQTRQGRKAELLFNCLIGAPVVSKVSLILCVLLKLYTVRVWPLQVGPEVNNNLQAHILQHSWSIKLHGYRILSPK